MGVRAHACGRLKDTGEAEREGVFQCINAGVYDGGIETCELLLERVCMHLAGEKCGSVEEIQLGVVWSSLQAGFEGLVGGFKGCRRLLGKCGASCLEAGLSARKWRCRESQNQDEE